MKKAPLISTSEVEALDNSFSTVDFTLKVVNAGEAGVGKTSMVRSKEGLTQCINRRFALSTRGRISK